MNNWSNLSNITDIKFTTPLPNLSELAPDLNINSRILDLGCGYGRALFYLYQKGFKNLVGIDISKELIDQAKKTCPNAKYYVQDFESISLKERFDLILLMAVIEYIACDRAQEKFFRKVENLLSNNGHVFLETFTYDFKLNLKNYLTGFIRTGHFGKFTNSMGVQCHHQSINKLKKILRGRFKIVYERKERFTTWSNNTCNGYMVVLKKKKHG